MDDIPEYVKLAQKGDKDAFAKIYNLFLEKIYRFVFYLIWDEDTAYDITQDTFVKAYKALGKYDKHRGAFGTFLYAIARNLVFDQRRKKVTLSLDLVGAIRFEPDFAEDIDEKERKRQVKEILETLPKHEKELVVLRYFEDLSFKQIAQIVGKDEGAVRVKVFRILKSLKEKLEGKI